MPAKPPSHERALQATVVRDLGQLLLLVHRAALRRGMQSTPGSLGGRCVGDPRPGAGPELLDALGAGAIRAVSGGHHDELPEVGDPQAVVGRRAVREAVGHDAAQEQVDVVLVGEADPAVHLDAVLHQLGEEVAGVRLGGARRLGGRRVPRRAARAPRPAAIAWLASSHSFMSAKRCLSAWYGRERAPERVAVERPLDGEVERDLRRAGGLRGLARRRRAASCQSRSAAAHAGGRPTRRAGDAHAVELDPGVAAGHVDALRAA